MAIGLVGRAVALLVLIPSLGYDGRTARAYDGNPQTAVTIPNSFDATTVTQFLERIEGTWHGTFFFTSQQYHAAFQQPGPLLVDHDTRSGAFVVAWGISGPGDHGSFRADFRIELFVEPNGLFTGFGQLEPITILYSSSDRLEYETKDSYVLLQLTDTGQLIFHVLSFANGHVGSSIFFW